MSNIEDIDRALAEIDEEHKGVLTGEQRETLRAVDALLREKTTEVRTVLPGHKELARVLAKNNEPCTCRFDYPGAEFDENHPTPPACCDARAVLDFMRSHALPPDDPPVADPAERARFVARELRRRGIFAARLGDGSFAPELGYEGVGVLGMNKAGKVAGMSYGFDPEDAPRSVRDLADEIQREEARRAAEWAGDEGSDP